MVGVGAVTKYMVIERFKDGCWEAVYERFQTHGRLLPDGLYYVDSWASKSEMICYQLMETDQPDLFERWFSQWSDLVDFEVTAID